VICGPGQHEVKYLRGRQRLDVDYSASGSSAPLSSRGRATSPTSTRSRRLHFDAPEQVRHELHATRSLPAGDLVTTYQMPTGVQFFDALGQQLAAFPPPARDDAELRQLAEVGIGPGMTPSRTRS